MAASDVVIVGAGIIGTAIAYILSRSTRLRVVVIDRGTPGCEASNAAAGVLGVASSHARRGVLFELRRRSGALFPELVAALQEETAIDVGYRTNGLLSLARSEADASGLAELVQHRTAQGFRCEFLDAAALRSIEPAVSPRISGAAWFPDEASLRPDRFVLALVDAARQRGVEFRLNVAVRAVVGHEAGASVDLGEETLAAGTVVVAAGGWSSQVLAGCGHTIPIRPARGEMLAVRRGAWAPRHILASGDTYLVPRDGEIVIGSTMAFVGFDKEVTAKGVAQLLSDAEVLLPDVRNASLIRTWAGLRPCSSIRRPIIARLPRHPRIILASGHHRNGILLAPITAQLVCEMVTDAPPSVPMHPFGYRRH